MSIGQRIKNERIRLNLSQEDVAKAISSTKQAIYKYENEIVTNIPMDKIEKMAKLFSVTPAYLMGWEDIGDKKPTAMTDGEPAREDVVIFHRDGKTQKRKLSKDQLAMLIAMVDALPASDDED